MTFGGTPVQDTNGYDIFKTFEDLFLSVYERDEMLMEGIQSTKLCKFRSNSGDKPTSGVDAENKLEAVYKMKYKINLDHQILTSSGVFYPQALDKGILLLFIVPYTAGARDSENYFNPDITNVEVTINGIPNRVYNNGIKGHDMWREASPLI